jgi:hypothetical protein
MLVHGRVAVLLASGLPEPAPPTARIARTQAGLLPSLDDNGENAAPVIHM